MWRGQTFQMSFVFILRVDVPIILDVIFCEGIFYDENR